MTKNDSNMSRLSFVLLGNCNPGGLAQVSKQPKCTKVLNESAKCDLVLLDGQRGILERQRER